MAYHHISWALRGNKVYWIFATKKYHSFQNDICILLSNLVRTDTSLVRMRGLEPPRRWHWFLRPARLPVPPHPHFSVNIDYGSTFVLSMSTDFWCFFTIFSISYQTSPSPIVLFHSFWFSFRFLLFYFYFFWFFFLLIIICFFYFFGFYYFLSFY